MYLAHCTGQIAILAPGATQYVREQADAIEPGFDADATLQTIVELARRTGVVEAAVATLNELVAEPRQ